MKIMLTISYDGTNYYGWQRQTNKITVQGEIEKALSKIYNKEIQILGTSRTDRGVHAIDQKACFSVENTHIPPEKIFIVLNKILNDDIKLIDSSRAADNFHPIACALRKTYKYSIFNGSFENPINRLYSVYVKDFLDVEKMERAGKEFIGTYDFIAFCSTGSNKTVTTRTIYDFKLWKENDMIFFEITGNGFLYNMVRTIAGLLIRVGLGKIPVSEIKNIILSKNRNLSNKTAPAKGLCLVNVLLKP